MHPDIPEKGPFRDLLNDGPPGKGGSESVPGKHLGEKGRVGFVR